jgi:anti-repressor protein
MNELIPAADLGRLCPINARDLHAKLGSRRDFSNWIKGRIERFELSEGADYQKVEDLSSPDSASSKARSQVIIEYYLSIYAATLIAGAENTAEGRSYLRFLVKVGEAWNSPEMVCARGMQMAQELLGKKNELIAVLSAKARAADLIADSTGLKLLSDIGKINGQGPIKFIRALIARGYLFRRDGAVLPYQQYIDSGYFAVREKPYFDAQGVSHLFSQTYVTGKGEVWLAKQFFPVVRAEAIGASA